MAMTIFFFFASSFILCLICMFYYLHFFPSCSYENVYLGKHPENITLQQCVHSVIYSCFFFSIAAAAAVVVVLFIIGVYSIQF